MNFESDSPWTRVIRSASDAHLPVGFAVIGAGDVVHAWNDIAARLLATPAAEAIGHRFVDLEVSYRVPGLRAAVEQAKRTGAGVTLDDVLVDGPAGRAHLTSGARGVDLALANPPDVALADLGLPDMDGYEVARRIRAALGTGPRLVALTGYGHPDARRRTQDAGFDAHLVKPVDYQAVEQVLVTL
jgi:CheY-like chemotaxis protein